MKLVGVQCEHCFSPLEYTSPLVLLVGLGVGGGAINCLIVRKLLSVESWTCHVLKLAQGDSKGYYGSIKVSKRGLHVESESGQCMPVSERKKQI